MACCDDKKNAPANERTNSESMAAVFAALSNPARIDILRHISQHRHCGCKEITDVLPLAQSTISQHLKVLSEAGLIEIETVHPRSHYQINEKLLNDLSITTRDFLKSCCQSICC